MARRREEAPLTRPRSADPARVARCPDHAHASAGTAAAVASAERCPPIRPMTGTARAAAIAPTASRRCDPPQRTVTRSLRLSKVFSPTQLPRPQVVHRGERLLPRASDDLARRDRPDPGQRLELGGSSRDSGRRAGRSCRPVRAPPLAGACTGPRLSVVAGRDAYLVAVREHRGQVQGPRRPDRCRPAGRTRRRHRPGRRPASRRAVGRRPVGSTAPTISTTTSPDPSGPINSFAPPPLGGGSPDERPPSGAPPASVTSPSAPEPNAITNAATASRAAPPRAAIAPRETRGGVGSFDPLPGGSPDVDDASMARHGMAFWSTLGLPRRERSGGWTSRHGRDVSPPRGHYRRGETSAQTVAGTS